MLISAYQTADFRRSAKSVAVDLLSTMPARHPVPVGSLVRAALVLGIGENSMRVALARLRSRGLVTSDERGLYHLSAAAEPINREVRSWRTLEQTVCDWDGSWVALDASSLPRGDRKGARKRARALQLLGFAPLSPALQVRPANLLRGVGGVRERLEVLGFAPDPVVFGLAELDVETDARARALWDVSALEAGYEASRAQLVKSAQRLPSLSTEEAMAESFRVGGEAVRRIVLDPLLPDPIVDGDARRALVDEMRRYDRIGRSYWKAWAGASVVLENSPASVGDLAAARAPA